MPFGFLGAVLGAGTDYYQQQAQNRENRQIMMQQRHWSLADRENERNWQLTNWHRQNEYNSPLAQMARYKAAGLNPNLIYGQQNIGGSIGSPSTRATPSAKIERRNFIPPELVAQLQSLSAQTDNVKEQTKNTIERRGIMEQDQILRTWQAANAEQQHAKGAIDLEFARELKETSLEGAKANNEMTRRRIAGQILLNEFNDRSMQDRLDQLLYSKNRARTQSQIDQINLKIKEFEKDLLEKGIDPKSPWYIKTLGRMSPGVNTQGTPSRSNPFSRNYRATGSDRPFFEMPWQRSFWRSRFDKFKNNW